MPAIVPFTVRGVAIFASKVVKRSMPPVFSSTPISTLTPHTIRITAHGICRTLSASSPSFDMISTVAATKADNPGFSLRNTTASTQSTMTPIVSQ